MKRNILILFALAFCTLSLQAGVEHLMPKVKQLSYADGGGFALNRSVVLDDPTGNPALKRSLAGARLTVSADGAATVRVEIVDEIAGAFNQRLADYPDEAYTLSVKTDEVVIQALNATGVTRAAQTLAQLALEVETLEAVSITDWPSFKLRGFMQDVGRSFLPVDELKREIDLLSAFKVNTFHWHLTDYTGWRLEIKAYPQLTEKGITRFPGMYYTQEQAKEIQDYAAERGMIVIPEIDMPGHSHPFENAMGHDMQSEQGIAELKVILSEVCALFDKAPYIHIGGDEKKFPDSYIVGMIDYVHSLGKKVVIWNQYNAGPAKKVDPAVIPCDMTTNWATSGRISAGVPNIDMRYNYTNHFDVFADLVGIYKSSIFDVPQGTDDVAGTISAAWCDTRTPTPDDIVRQNNIYANVLASAERAWIGGGRQYIETGGVTLPNFGGDYDDFADWERRFLYHKHTTLAAAAHQIPYVRQTDVRWSVTDQIPNGGNAATRLAPEDYLEAEVMPASFTIDGTNYGVNRATGAGIYLRHIWHPTVKGFYDNPQNGMTAYAWTYIYSPVEQDCGALVEFYTYSRSGNEKAPLEGCWDRRDSRIWFNGTEIAAPVWQQPDASIPQDHDTRGLTNENFTARPPVQLHLQAGWNKVFMKLPHANSGGTMRDKWQFTFVLTDPEGGKALDGLIYSPSRSLDPVAESVAAAILDARSRVAAVVGTEVGSYKSGPLDAALLECADACEATLGEVLSADERGAQLAELQKLLAAFEAGYKEAGIVLPASGANYKLVSLRANRAAYANGSAVSGADSATGEIAAWGFVGREDGTFDIRNYSTRTFVSPTAAYNTQLQLVSVAPAAGWTIHPAATPGYTIITSEGTQFNQTNLNNAVYNWGGGDNINDQGCQYRFVLTDYVDELPSSVAGVGSDRFFVAAGKGMLTVYGADVPANIYDLQGRCVASGLGTIRCQAGVYLVSVPGHICKVHVR